VAPSTRASGLRASTMVGESFRLMRVKYSQELLKMESLWGD
jgi:hypothetical protein